MKVVLFGMSLYNYTKSIKYALEQLGYEVLMVIDDNNGLNSIYLNFNKQKMLDFKPDIFINFCGNYKFNLIDKEFLNNITGRKILMYADAISYTGTVKQNIECYDKIIVFEPQDVNYVKEIYKKECVCVSGSVAEEIYCKKYTNVDILYDLSFVGAMSTERLIFFNEIAKYVNEKNLKMVIYGHFWHNKHWWQKILAKLKFKFRYPYLIKYAKNYCLEPEKVALLYKQTKICLNKHVDRHQGINYRTFEIMANNNFVLCDERIQANEYGLINGQNIVFYKNLDDCLNKIEYYINNDVVRNTIAQNGGELVRNFLTTKMAMKKILE